MRMIVWFIVLLVGVSGCAPIHKSIFDHCPQEDYNCAKAEVRFHYDETGRRIACGTQGVFNPCWEVQSDLEGKI